MKNLLFLLGLLAPLSAHAAEADLYCLTGTSSTGAPIFKPASPSLPCPTTSRNVPSTYQGTMTIGAAASTALIIANATLAPNSAALPTSFANDTITVINTGATNAVYACWGGGTASATSGCELLNAGSGDTVTFGTTGTPPTFFSTSGTTIAFRQGN